MALYWPEARMTVECADAASQGDHGKARDKDGDLVITMRPEQADDPSFVGEMQRLVVTRGLERMRMAYERLIEGWEHGKVPTPTRKDVADERLGEAERRFERNFMKGLADRDEGDAEARDEAPSLDEVLESYLRSETYREGSPLVQVVVQHCDEVVVGA